jgi:hypothetical protein
MSELTLAPSFRFANAIARFLPYFRYGARSAGSWESPAPGIRAPDSNSLRTGYAAG